ncbi:MAG: rhomboid family intramembrane serine protease [Anaerorhabdus sp.]
MNNLKSLKLKLGGVEIIGIICIINFLLINGLPFVFNNITTVDSAIFMGAYYKAFISGSYEFFRFLTVGLTHIDFLHLFVNMVALYQLNNFCKAAYGSKKTLIMLALSTVGGSLFLYCLGGNTLAVGLSGGLYGLMAAMLTFSIENNFMNNPVYRNNIISMLMMNLLINFMPGIAVSAHLGGFITGGVLSVLFSTRPSWDILRRNTKLAGLLFCVAIPFLIYAKHEIPTSQIYRGTDANVYSIMDAVGLDFYESWSNENMTNYYNSLGGR